MWGQTSSSAAAPASGFGAAAAPFAFGAAAQGPAASGAPNNIFGPGGFFGAATPAFGGAAQPAFGFGGAAQPASGFGGATAHTFGLPSLGGGSGFGGFGGTATGTVPAVNQIDGFCETPGRPDSISKLAWRKGGCDFIAASNWDGHVRVYQRSLPTDSFKHVASASTHNSAPVLCVDWHNDGASFFTCGADNTVTRCTLNGGAITATPIAHHDAAVKTLTWWSDANLLVTGGFDDKMKYWDVRQQQPVHVMPCPGKVQCIASRGPTMVMTCLNHTVGDVTCKSAVYAFDKNSPTGSNIRSFIDDAQRPTLHKHQTFEPMHQSPVSLSHQIRCIGIMRNGFGWCLGGSEGRCVVEYRADVPVPPSTPPLEILFKSTSPKLFGPVQHPMTANFNFKCHRQDEKTGGSTISNAFPCNGVSFNERHNTLATCGSDGTYVFWDQDNRKKLKGFPEQKPAAKVASFGNSIIDIEFSADSDYIAFAVAYDWAKGPGGKKSDNEGLYVRRVAHADIAPQKMQ
jgi:mRNA export factor